MLTYLFGRLPSLKARQQSGILLLSWQWLLPRQKIFTLKEVYDLNFALHAPLIVLFRLQPIGKLLTINQLSIMNYFVVQSRRALRDVVKFTSQGIVYKKPKRSEATSSDMREQELQA